jgi:hypothetical protein
MKTYKITQVYLVAAETKGAALAKVHSAEGTEYLNVEFAKETDAADEHATWSNAVKQQVFGANK